MRSRKYNLGTEAIVREQLCAAHSMDEERIGPFGWIMATNVKQLCLIEYFEA